LSPDFQPSRKDSECPPVWRPKDRFNLYFLLQKVGRWFKEQSALMEAFCVAISFHVLLFPLIWFIGWALPWPKPPSMTTVIEINLEHWPEDARPGKIEHLYDVEMSKARAGQH
jgi:hypothetical protein